MKKFNHPHASIERKHQNISAVLLEARFPYIDGYKPLSNYQGLLSDSVLAHLEDDAQLAALARHYVEAPAPAADEIGDPLEARMVAPPNLLELARLSLSNHARVRQARKYDYLALEARNRMLGNAGERFVVTFERARLTSYGLKDLASRVEHVSETRGDGLGYDVLSYSRE